MGGKYLVVNLGSFFSELLFTCWLTTVDLWLLFRGNRIIVREEKQKKVDYFPPDFTQIGRCSTTPRIEKYLRGKGVCGHLLTSYTLCYWPQRGLFLELLVKKNEAKNNQQFLLFLFIFQWENFPVLFHIHTLGVLLDPSLYVPSANCKVKRQECIILSRESLNALTFFAPFLLQVFIAKKSRPLYGLLLAFYRPKPKRNAFVSAGDFFAISSTATKCNFVA